MACRESWIRPLQRQFYNSLPIRDERIWRCNTDQQDIKRYYTDETLSAARSIWSAWSTYHFQMTISEPENFLYSYLWGNSLIRKASKPIFNPLLVNSNIDRVWDIYNVSKHDFYEYEQIVNQYGPVLQLLDYYSLRTSTPKTWKVELRNFNLKEPMDPQDEVDSLDTLTVKPSKHIYWNLIEQKVKLDNPPGMFN